MTFTHNKEVTILSRLICLLAVLTAMLGFTAASASAHFVSWTTLRDEVILWSNWHGWCGEGTRICMETSASSDGVRGEHSRVALGYYNDRQLWTIGIGRQCYPKVRYFHYDKVEVFRKC